MPRFNPLMPPDEALPPEQVRILDAQIEPWPDGRRVKVLASITPFLKPADLSISILDMQGEEAASAYIVENVDDRLALTLHLRSPQQGGSYRLLVRVIYQDLGEVDTREVDFETSFND